MDDIQSELFKKMKEQGRTAEMTFKFGMMYSDELRVVMALTAMGIFGIKPTAKCVFKDPKVSINFRNEANRIFVSNKGSIEQLTKAWELYSKSIATAPTKSQELSLAYANRSALLMDLQKYKDCIDDIDRALALNYPNHLKGKLLCRKIACLKVLNQSANVKDVVEETRKWLENVSLNNEEKEKFQKKIEDSTSKLSTEPPANKKNKDLPKLTNPNKHLPCASDALELKYNEQYGRYLTTTRNVNPGEILIIEKAYGKILYPEEAYTHCSHCFEVHWAMIPCEFCTYAMYCSDKCRLDARKQYHDIECPVTGYLLDLEFHNRGLFSIRLAILALREAGSIEKLKNYLTEVESCKDPLKKGFDKNQVYRSDKYYSLYSLVTNTEKRSTADLFQRALPAAVILYYLYTVTPLFGKKNEPNFHEIGMNEDATFVGGLILRHMQIIPCNIHSFEEERQIDKESIGAAALSFCSLINHSCDPNVSRFSAGDYTVIFAVYPLEKGEQIYDNYGSHFATKNKSEREQYLQQFYFTCSCRACLQDWPSYGQLKSYTKLLSGSERKTVKDAIKNLYLYISYASEDNIEDKPYILTDLSKMIKILYKYVPLPCYELNNAVETLKKVIGNLYGNKFPVPKITL